MNFIERTLLDLRARGEAAHAVDSVDDHIVAALGPRPVFDPVGNAEHGWVGDALNNQAELGEWRDDLRQREDELTRHPSVMGMNVFLVLLFGVEVLGATLVMRTVGYENPERLILGAMLGAFVFFITSLAARMPRTWWFYLVLSAYGALVVAIAALRADEMSLSAEGSAGLDWAAGVVMLCTTVGPAWVAEMIMRKREPAIRLAKEAARFRKRIRLGERRQRNAQRFVNRLARRSRQWDEGAAQARAVYTRSHRLAAARRSVVEPLHLSPLTPQPRPQK